MWGFLCRLGRNAVMFSMKAFCAAATHHQQANGTQVASSQIPEGSSISYLTGGAFCRSVCAPDSELEHLDLQNFLMVFANALSRLASFSLATSCRKHFWMRLPMSYARHVCCRIAIKWTVLPVAFDFKFHKQQGQAGCQIHVRNVGPSKILDISVDVNSHTTASAVNKGKCRSHKQSDLVVVTVDTVTSCYSDMFLGDRLCPGSPGSTLHYINSRTSRIQRNFFGDKRRPCNQIRLYVALKYAKCYTFVWA